MRDSTALSLLRLDERTEGVVKYVNRLKLAMNSIEEILFPGEILEEDLESVMDQLKAVPIRVESWKKSAARCGADVALSLVRVHFKNIDEEKLKSLRVANTKKLQFQDFLETFVLAATQIADAIDLDVFIDPASPTPDA